MAFNGSGVFNRIYSWANDKANSINITASRFDTEDNGFATGLSTCLTKDGQQTATQRIPFAQGIQLPTGSTAAPGLAIAGDLTTGFYQGATGSINFCSEGVLTATLNANGLDNTPIGVGTPNYGQFSVISVTTNSYLGGGIVGYSTLTVAGDTQLQSTLEVTGAVTLTAGISVGTTLGVTGASTFTGAVALNGSGTTTTQAIGNSSTHIATTAFANPATTNSASGTVTLPGGTIIKWGTSTSSGTSAGNLVISFGTAFPNAIYSFTATVQQQSSYFVNATTTSVSGVTANVNSASAFINAVPVNWVAIGS